MFSTEQRKRESALISKMDTRLRDPDILRVKELEEPGIALGDALGIVVGRHVAKPQPHVADRRWKPHGEGGGQRARAAKADAVDIEGVAINHVVDGTCSAP